MLQRPDRRLKICPECEKEFLASWQYRGSGISAILQEQTYCSCGCANKSRRNKTQIPVRTCKNCGKSFELPRYLDKMGVSQGFHSSQKSRIFCSRHCAYEAQRSDWHVDKNGYRYCTSNGKGIYEHRIVMERKIGRELLAHETVHHKNGDRSDNKIDNLELWSSRQPGGQRMADKIEHAIDLLTEQGISFIQNDSTWVNGLLSL